MGNKLLLVLVPAALLLLGALLWLLLRGKGGAIDGPGLIGGFDESEGERVLLVEYCKRRVATVGGDGYSKTALYQLRDGRVEVHFFRFYEGDAAEAHSFFETDPALIAEVYGLINEACMAEWNGKYNGPGLEGASYSVRFRTEDGSYLTVSSDRMPEDGVRLLGAVGACLSGAQPK